MLKRTDWSFYVYYIQLNLRIWWLKYIIIIIIIILIIIIIIFVIIIIIIMQQCKLLYAITVTIAP